MFCGKSIFHRHDWIMYISFNQSINQSIKWFICYSFSLFGCESVNIIQTVHMGIVWSVYKVFCMLGTHTITNKVTVINVIIRCCCTKFTQLSFFYRKSTRLQCVWDVIWSRPLWHNDDVCTHALPHKYPWTHECAVIIVNQMSY